MRPRGRALTLSIISALCALPSAWAQSRIPAASSNYLASGLSQGGTIADHDGYNVVFFEVPDTVSPATPIYFALNHDSINDTNGIDRLTAGDMTGAAVTFTLYGGAGCLSHAESKYYDYVQQGGSPDHGTPLATITDTVAASTGIAWSYFPAVYANQGEHIGNKYYFKVVADASAAGGTTGEFTHAYQLDISYLNSGAPGGILGVRSFMYSWTMFFRANNVFGVFPFVPSGDTGTIVYHNLYYGLTETANAYNLTPALAGAVTISNTEAWPGVSSAFSLAGQTGGCWEYRDTNLGSVSDGTFWFTNSVSGQAYRAYSSSFVLQAADHVSISPASSTRLVNTDETMVLQVVDASGNPVEAAVDVWVYTDSATARIDAGLAGAGKLVTTDGTGMATFLLRDSAPGTSVLVSLETDGAPGFSALDDALASPLANGTATVTFVADPEPTASSQGNTSFAENAASPRPLAAIEVTDSGTANITNLGNLRIVLPAGLGATFQNVASVTVTGANAGTYAVAYVDAGRTAVITIPGGFATGTTTFAGLQLAGPYSVSSGSLGISWNGDSVPDAYDDKVVSITSQYVTYAWNGAGTDWFTPANWTPNGVPSLATDDAVIPFLGAAANYPTLSADAAVTNLRNLSIAAGARLTLGDFDLAIAGTLQNGGTVIVPAAGRATAGDADSGSFRYTAPGAIAAYAGADYWNLELAGAGSFTASAALAIGGALTLSDAGAILDLGGDDLAVGGAVSNLGTVRLAGTQTVTLALGNDTASGTWEYTSAGAAAIHDFGATDFRNLTVSGAGSFASAGPIAVAGAYTQSAGTLSLSGGDLAVGGALNVTGGTIAASAPRQIGAASINLATAPAGYRIDSGAALTLAAAAGVNVNLGAAGAGFELTNAELAKIRAAGLGVQASGAGAITVNGVSGAATADTGALGLSGAAALNFATAASTFASGVSAATTGALSVSVGVTASAGNLSLTSGSANLAISGAPTLRADAGTLSLLSTGGAVNLASALVLQAAYINQPAETIAMNANALTLRADEIDFAALSSVTGSGALVIEPLSAAMPVGILSADMGGRLDLTAADFLAFSDTYASMTIGRTNGTGAISLAAPLVASLPPLVFEGDDATANLVRIQANLGNTTAGRPITFNARSYLAANVQTDGGAISFNQPVTLGAASVTVDSEQGDDGAAGAITFAAGATLSADAANRSLALDGRGAVRGTVTLRAVDASGGALPHDLGIYAGALSFNGPVATANDQSYNIFSGASSALAFSGNRLSVLVTNAAAQAISLSSAANNMAQIDLRTTTDGATAAAGAISYTDANDVEVVRVLGASTASLTSLAGGLTDSGPIACTTLAVSSVTGAMLDFGHTLSGFTAGNASSGAVQLHNTGALTVTAANISQYSGGTVTLRNTGAVTLTGSINAGTGTINLDTLGAGTITGAGLLSGGTINLQATAGSTGRVGTSSALPVNLSGTTGLSLGQGASLAGAFIAHAGALTLASVQLSANQPLDIRASGALTLPAQAIDTGTAALYLQSGAGLATAGALGSLGSSGNIDMIALAGAIAINDATSTSGTLTLRGTAGISQGAAIACATLDARTLNNAGAPISLNDPGNEAATVSLRALNGAGTLDAAGAISYRDASGFDVAALRTAAAATVQGGGLAAHDLSQSGDIAAGGQLTVIAGLGDAIFSRATNALASASVTSAALLSLNDADGYTLLACAATGNISAISATGNITVTGALSTAGAPGASIALNPAGTILLSFAGTVASTDGGLVRFQKAVTLGANTAVDTDAPGAATAGGNVQFDAAVSGAFALSVDATADGGGSNGTIIVSGAIATPTALSLSGSMQINGGAVSTSLAQTYNGPVRLGAATNFTAPGGNLIRFNGTFGGDATARAVTVTNANVRFDGTVGGAGNLVSTLNIAAGTAALYANVTTSGNQTYGGAVTLGASVSVLSGAGTMNFASTIGESAAATLTLQDGAATGAVTLGGAVTLTGLAFGTGIYNVSMNGTGSSVANLVEFTNRGTLSLGQALGTVTFNGGVETTGNATNPSAVTIFGTIAASNDPMTLGPITLGANAILHTNATDTAGDLVLGAVTGATFNLTLETGTPAANADLTATTVTGVGILTLQNIGGTASFAGSVSATALTIPATVLNLSLGGSTGTITNNVAFANAGTLSLGAAAGTLVFNGGFSTAGVGGTVTLYGTLRTSDDAIVLGAFSLGANTVLDTAAATAAGTVSIGALSGGAYTLEINTNAAGGVTQSAGTVTSASLRIITGGSIGLAGTPLAVDVDFFEASAGGLVNVSNLGALTVGFVGGTYAATGVSTSAGPITLAADDLVLAETLSGPAALLLQPRLAATTVSIGTAGGAFSLLDADLANLSNGFASITIGRSDSATVAIDTASFRDPITVLGGADITINSGALSLATTQDNASITVVSGAGSSIFVNGDISANGSGAVTLTSGLSIAMDADSQVASGSGTITLDAGSVPAGSLTLDVVQTAGGLVTLRAGTLGSIAEADNTALVSAPAGILYINDLVAGSSVGGAGAAALNTTIATLRARAAGNVYISETNALQIGDATMGVSSTGGLVSVVAGGAVTTGAAVSALGALSVTGQSIAVSQNLGSTGSAQISLAASSGAITQSGGLISSAAGLLSLSASTFLGTNVAPLQTAVATLRAVAANGGIYVNEADGIALGDGGGGLSATNGDIIITAAGAMSSGNALATASAGNVTLATAAGGTMTLGNSISSAGSVTLTNAGALTLGGDITAVGAVTQNGAGAVGIAVPRSISTSGGAVDFLRAVTMSGGGAGLLGIDTTASVPAGASIRFQSILDASTASPNSERLALSAGTGGTVTFASAVGATVAASRLGAVSISGANNVNVNASVVAASLSQAAGAGTTTFSGTVNLNAPAGLAVNAANIILNGAVSTASGGGVTLNPAILLTIAAAADMNLDGPFSQGGAGTVSTAGDITTTDDDIGFLRAVSLAGPVALSTGAGLGNIAFSSSVSNAAPQTLSLSAGTGSISFGSTVGSLAFPLDRLSLFNAATISSSGDIRAVNGVVTRMGSGATAWNGTINLPNTDLYLDHAGVTLTFGANLSCRNLYFYRGGLNLAGRTVSTGADFAAFGTAYSPNDADWTGADSRHGYFPAPGLAYYPGAGTYNAGTGLFSTAPSAGFANLTASILNIGASFYDNGADMNVGAFTLNLPAAAGTAPQFNNTGAAIAGQWGAPYAAAFNMTVAGATANNAIVCAAADPDGAGMEAGQGVVDGGGNAGWQFGRPQVSWAATVYDDVVRVEFQDQFGAPMLIENSLNEINTRLADAAASLALGSLWYNGGALRFDGAFVDAACATPTNGAGDLSEFYVRAGAGPWNTDATGASAGDTVNDALPAGDERSTDRSGATRNAVPDLSFLKGLFRAADGKTMARAYGPSAVSAFPAYTATVDRCRPVLIRVEAGQSAHLVAPYETWDGHNYLQLKWSEPVNLGASAGFTIADPSAANVKSQASFAAAGEHGGTLSGAGTVTASGYFSASGGADLRSRNAADALDAEVNGMYRSGPNAYGTAGLFISVAGWSFPADGTLFWPGYIDSAVQPGGVVGSMDNAYITDAAGNRLEPSSDAVPRDILGSAGPASYSPRAKSAVSVTALPGWDLVAPAVVFNPLPAPGDYDVVPYVTTPAETQIERFELRFSEGVRDTSLTYPTASAGFLDTAAPAFRFRALDGVLPYRYGGSLFSTAIASGYLGGPINTQDDQLLSIVLTVPELTPDWTTTSQMYFTYDQSTGLVSDWAGNLLAEYSSLPSEKACIEKIPPRIRLATAIEADSRIYVVFTEPVRKGPIAASTTVLTPADFALSLAPSMGGISGVTAGSLDADGWVLDAYLNLSGTVTTRDMLDARIQLAAGAANIIDKKDNMADPATRRAVDIGMGVVNVLSASDGIHADVPGTDPGLVSGALGTLRLFDGSGRLYDKDVTLFASLDLSPPADLAALAALPVSMYFDASAPADSYAIFDIAGRPAALGLWLPSFLPGYNRVANLGARAVAPFYSGSLPSTARNFLIPASDPDMVSGAEMGFLFRIGSLYLAREAVPGDPRGFDLWRFKVQDVLKQSGGVTILNNVIDSSRRERTAIQVDLAEGGQVSILVFTLDGDVVKALQRGRLGAGNYTFTWDGTNASGDAVARGIYFIRVVGPGLDEIRKVMVVKN